MKHISSVVALGLSALVWVAPVRATDEHQHGGGAPEQAATPQVWEGRLVDLSCYLMGMKESTGPHAQCAMQCAQKGVPVGLVDSKTNNVYTVVVASPALAPHMAQPVRITGTLHEEHLLAVEKLEVQDNGVWKTVELPAAM